MTFIDSKNASATLTTTTSFLTGHFTSLKKFHVYHLSVEAFTSKGSGPKAFASASSDQDGNSNSCTLMISTGSPRANFIPGVEEKALIKD